jgi:hypothetical protein
MSALREKKVLSLRLKVKVSHSNGNIIGLQLKTSLITKNQIPINQENSKYSLASAEVQM